MKKLVVACYLEHVCVVVMAVLHHYCLVTGQSERDTVLPPAVNNLQQQQEHIKMTFSGKIFLHLLIYHTNADTQKHTHRLLEIPYGPVITLSHPSSGLFLKESGVEEGS